jgi:hypothetical protein
MSVIFAAGEDPLRYDAQPSNGVWPAAGAASGDAEHEPYLPEAAIVAFPSYIGYRVGGRNRPANPEGFAYCRDG